MGLAFAYADWAAEEAKQAEQRKSKEAAEKELARQDEVRRKREAGGVDEVVETCDTHSSEPSEPNLWCNVLETIAQWNSLSVEAAGSQVLKFLVDTTDQWKVYWTESVVYRFHYIFVTRNLKYTESLSAFNRKMYKDADRRFILGTVARYPASEASPNPVFVLELNSADNLDGASIVHLMEKLSREAPLFKGGLCYRPLSELHERQIASVKSELNLITGEELFGSLKFQALTVGVANGRLRVIQRDTDFDPDTVLPDEVLVTHQLPVHLPVVRGLVSSTPQTPLCHTALLCANRDTPNCFLVDAESRFADLAGKNVEIRVSKKGVTIEESSPAGVAGRPDGVSICQPNLKNRRLINLNMPSRDGKIQPQTLRLLMQYVGAKATQTAQICACLAAAGSSSVSCPEGFGIPFSYYVSHIETLSEAVKQDMKDLVWTGENWMADGRITESGLAEIVEKLKRVREAIVTAKVDEKLLDATIKRIDGSAWTSVIFRSSTNAEDLPGFNGAGLYESVAVLRQSSMDFRSRCSEAIREVWASVWSTRGFLERAHFGVPQGTVAMAVLVQPMIDDAAVVGKGVQPSKVLVNGVALTGNPTSATHPGLFINARAGGTALVTALSSTEACEQVIVYTGREAGMYDVEILTRGVRADGAQGVLHEEDTQKLAANLDLLHDKMLGPRVHVDPPVAGGKPKKMEVLDVEFLVREHGEIVILQARPFEIVYKAAD